MVSGPRLESHRKWPWIWREVSVETRRVVELHGACDGEGFNSNVVVTSKYTVLTFVFKNLYEQFHKYSNLYFVFIAILQCCPAITTTNGVPTFAWPLAFVLMVNGCKDAYEDWRRHRADDIENCNITHTIPKNWYVNESRRAAGLRQSVLSERDLSLLSGNLAESYNNQEQSIHRIIEEGVEDVQLGNDNEERSELHDDAFYEEEVEDAPQTDDLEKLGMVRKQWKKLTVGELVICRNREVFASDMILLCSSDQHGVAFVETSSLDGETNLKVRQGQSDCIKLFTQDTLTNIEIASGLQGRIECSAPDKDLTAFAGNIVLETKNKRVEASLNSNQLLLRGCKLRNTEWVIAVSVYTGHESKIMMNSVDPPHKVSRVEGLTNRLTFLIWTVQISACMFGGIMSATVAMNPEYQNKSYLAMDKSDDPFVRGFVATCTWIVLSANLVPISLIVTMGMVKAMQAYFIMVDKSMFDPKTQTYACPRTSDLNEELGQVSYIFSDKTGTLTCNVMEFRKCCVGGKAYGRGLTDVRRQVMQKMGIPIPLEDLNTPPCSTPNVNFYDPSLESALMNANDPNHAELMWFFLHLSINHSVVPEIEEDRVRFSASSPDEGALVYAAKHFGIEFLGRDPTGVLLSVRGRKQRIEVLATIEFTSTRQRSSIVCRFPEPNKNGERIVLFCKGADSVIMNLLNGIGDKESRMLDEMASYARDALRTLCIAMRYMSDEEFVNWYAKYRAASLLTDKRAETIHALCEEIEVDLELQGITGIEDTLQDDVADTIEGLREAGIAVWMLTGDKVETAVNIGIAAGLIGGTHRLTYVWDALGSLEAIREKIKDDMMTWDATKAAISAGELNSGTLIPSRNDVQAAGVKSEPLYCEHAKPSLSVVIDGETLHHLLLPEMNDYFALFIRECKSVICSRVTPHQKGAVVGLVKRLEKHKITLAIGDGANDCNMIQTADVGVGLRGQEGLQAFNNSDYGLSKFSFLKHLLLVHGRWSYRRTTRLVLYMFYKNMVLVMPIFYFGFITLSSGQKIYSDFMYQLYNILFTALPIIVFGVLDQDVGKQECLRYPMLYRLNLNDYYFNNRRFICWILNGLWHGAVIFAIPLIGLGYTMIPDQFGQPLDRWMIGNTIFILVCLIVNLKMLCETVYLNYLPLTGIFLSISSLLVVVCATSNMPTTASSMLGVMEALLSAPIFYFVCLAVLVTGLSRDYLWRVIKRAYFPELYHLIQDREILNLAPEELTLVDAEKLRRRSTKYRDSIMARKSVTKLPSVARAESAARRKTTRGYAFSEADVQSVKLVWNGPHNDTEKNT